MILAIRAAALPDQARISGQRTGLSLRPELKRLPAGARAEWADRAQAHWPAPDRLADLYPDSSQPCQ